VVYNVECADRSNITSTAHWLLSSAYEMSWWTRSKAVSVKWHGLYPDCRLSCRLCEL